jgi:hypothetical protein
LDSQDLCIKATERNFRQELDKQVGGSWEKRAASRDMAQPAYPKFQTPTLFFYRLQTNNVLKAYNLTRRRRRTPPDLHRRSSRVDPTVTSETIPLCTVRLKINNRTLPRLMIEYGGTVEPRYNDTNFSAISLRYTEVSFNQGSRAHIIKKEGPP